MFVWFYKFVHGYDVLQSSLPASNLIGVEDRLNYGIESPPGSLFKIACALLSVHLKDESCRLISCILHIFP